jgi:CBS domain-containing protein
MSAYNNRGDIEMETRMPVRDVMSRSVVTADFDMNVVDAARKMLENDVGSIIIVKEGKPMGIVTERDIVHKLISNDKKPSSVKLGDLMSSPLIMITPDEDLLNATRMMAKMKIRRLPVIKDGGLIGILTDTDIISVSSEMNTILEELIEMSRERVMSQEGREINMDQGICEKCGELSSNLVLKGGLLLCESCRDEM